MTLGDKLLTERHLTSYDIMIYTKLVEYLMIAGTPTNMV